MKRPDKPLREMGNEEVSDLLDRLAAAVSRRLPREANLLIGFGPCKGETWAVASDVSKMRMVELLREIADKVERDQIESN